MKRKLDKDYHDESICDRCWRAVGHDVMIKLKKQGYIAIGSDILESNEGLGKDCVQLDITNQSVVMETITSL